MSEKKTCKAAKKECRKNCKDHRIKGTENKGAPAAGEGWRKTK